MTHRHTQPRPKARPLGFTLVELLVVMAILTVVVSGVVAVFLGSMKAIRQGYRHMDAYEMSRGAFQVVDRDLSGGFTSRDHGDYYSFYGTPYGMTFVGLASNFQGIGPDDETNLTRVSYVIRQLGYPIDSATGLPVRNAAGQPILDPATGRLISDPRDSIRTNEGQQLPAYVLIRYVERNADNLDAFKYVSWDGSAYGGLDPSEFQGNFPNQVANLATVYGNTVSWLQSSGFSAQTQERILDAKKRELFLRMLRGNGPVWVPQADGTWEPRYMDGAGYDAELPDYFDLLRASAVGYNATHPPVDRIPVPQLQDYIVATNIYYSPEEVLAALAQEAQLRGINVDDPNNGLLFFGIHSFDFGLALGTAGSASAAEAQTILASLVPSQSINQFSTPNRVGNYFVALSPFWNSGYFYNLSSHPTQVGYSDTTFGVWFGGEGSPLLPRIPSVVHMRLHLRFPAPNVAAADIERVLDQTIDIPTGYSRAQMGTS